MSRSDLTSSRRQKARLQTGPIHARLRTTSCSRQGGRGLLQNTPALGYDRADRTVRRGQRFVAEWLGGLINYDAIHGTQLVLTLSKYLDCGGNYDASALALSVHRSTLKYRLRRIREVSGHDIGHPDVQFNLQVATRAWRTLQALRLS